MKLFKTILLALAMLLITMCITMAQTKRVSKMQAPMEYPHYEKTWFKNEKKAIREAIAATKESHTSPRGKKRRIAKLAKLRTQLQEVSARKEGGHE